MSWYYRDINGYQYYTAYPRSKTIYRAVGDGIHEATPGEVVAHLEEHPDADLSRRSSVSIEYDVKQTQESAVELPPGQYLHVAGDRCNPERLVPTSLREDDLVDMKGTYDAIIKDVTLFLENENLYREIGIQYRRGILLYGPPGQGKCLGENTPVLMFNGAVEMAQNIKAGDLIMGPDSEPRKVVNTTAGRERLYRIHPVKGEPFVCNESHILSLKVSGPFRGHKTGDVINISVKDYLEEVKDFRVRTKLYRTGVDFEDNYEVAIEPYLLGYWLGDGDTNATRITTADTEVVAYLEDYVQRTNLKLSIDGESGQSNMYRLSRKVAQGANIFRTGLNTYGLLGNKHVPQNYKINSREVRLQILAGLIDSDGFVNDGCYTFSTTLERLADDVVYIARSLGFAAYKSKLNKKKQKETHKDAYYVYISGDMSQIPVRIERKKLPPRKQIKNVLITGFTLEDIGEGDYYGFELEGNDRLFLLGDFTVTHNTTTLRRIVRDIVPDDSVTIFLTELPSNTTIKAFSQGEMKKRLKVVIFEELAAVVNGSKYDIERILDFLDGETSLDRALIFGTTNYPENIPSNIVDRPSRFDSLIRMADPNEETRRALLRMYLCRDPSDEEVELTDGLSVAAIKETALFSRLYQTGFDVAVERMKSTHALVKEEFSESDTAGFKSGRRSYEYLSDLYE